MKQMRQGDIYIRRIEKTDLKLEQKDSHIIAYGEQTGHKHLLNPIEGKLLIATDGNRTVAQVGTAELVHEEHETHKPSNGMFEFIRQRELTLLNGTRQVMD